LLDFKTGAFKIAMRAGVPIVPVTILGTRKNLPKGSLAPRPGRVDVIIGEPIETRDYTDKQLHELMARTRKAIEMNLESGYRDEARREVSV
jgi:1-acyl-sn-glycerol-3-phosphate acyltransferase